VLGTFIRGTFADWKQIVHFSFTDKLDRHMLFEIIRNVENTGIQVCSIVSDMGSKNQGLWKDLDVGRVVKGQIEKTSFRHPYDPSRNVFVFPDFPHLLKLLRNHLIDTQLTLPDGTVLDKTIIQKLLEVQKHELRLTFKVTQKHISVRGKQRMKVRPAFELFSAKVAHAIRVAFPKRKSEAQFFEMINNFSDLMNTRSKPCQPSTIYKVAYGANYEKQTEFLTNFYQYFSQIRVGRRKPGTLAPFQKGFLMAIRSLIGLYLEMKQRTNAKYIMTARLNQDYVENTFGILRGAGGFDMKPDQVQSIRRVRRAIVGKRFNHSLGTNTQSEEDQTFISSASLKYLFSAPAEDFSGTQTNPLSEDMVIHFEEIDANVTVKDVSFTDLSLYEKCEQGGKEYVAGFIAEKLLEKYPELARHYSEYTPENSMWLRELTEGGLTEPSTLWFSYFCKFEEFFEVMHGYGKVNRDPKVVQRLADFLNSKYPEIPERAVNLYAKTRTMIRIATINKETESRKFVFQEQRRALNLPHNNMDLEADEDNEVEHEEVQDTQCEENLEELLDLLDPINNIIS